MRSRSTHAIRSQRGVGDRLSVIVVGALLAAIALPTAAYGEAQAWIVVLREGADSAQVAAEHAGRYEAQISDVYAHALRGYAAVIPGERLADVRADDRVAYLEADGIATTAAQLVPYGITAVNAHLSSTQAGDGSGSVSNVNAYVIDTGIDRTHPDLNVVGHVDFAGGPNRDCNGHGTHVAGTIAASDNDIDVVGVAPGVPLTGVKVLGCKGLGKFSRVLAGIDWVTANAARPAIATMSLEGPLNMAVDAAVRHSAESGIFYALAAGNSATDACTRSPANVGAGINGIMTVAATDMDDQESSFSNFGSCVDIYAPGVSVLSTRNGPAGSGGSMALRGETETRSGTSSAAAHVAGGAALYLSTHTDAMPTTVESALLSAATATGTQSKDGRSIFREKVATF